MLKQSSYTDEFKKQIVALYKNGKSVKTFQELKNGCVLTHNINILYCALPIAFFIYLRHKQLLSKNFYPNIAKYIKNL